MSVPIWCLFWKSFVGTATVFTLTSVLRHHTTHSKRNVLRVLDNECHPSLDLRRMVTGPDPGANINIDLSFTDTSVTSQTSLTSTSNNTFKQTKQELSHSTLGIQNKRLPDLPIPRNSFYIFAA